MSKPDNVDERKKLQKQREKNKYENQREERQSEYDENEEKIKRLKTAKTQLETNKNAAEANQKEFDSKFSNEEIYENWIGDKKTVITDGISYVSKNLYVSYVQYMDDVLDAVCDELTRLENKNMRLHGDILRLGGLINSLGNEIEKLTN